MDIFLKTASALNDATRILLLAYLDKYGESCVCDLQNSLGMIQSRLSRHLKILKEAGFIRVQRKGTWAYYSIFSPLDRFRSDAIEEIRGLGLHLEANKVVKKKVLVLCTGNSCRSIMAEALLNAKMGKEIEAFSSGVEASGEVNPNAKKLLQSKNLWRDSYHSKTIETLLEENFDLIVTVCDHAKESCPTFQNASQYLHISFSDPSTLVFKEYEKTLSLIEKKLLPAIKSRLFS